MTEFFVGNYRVDMTRSQIVAEDDIVSMEPKVLQVLLILAENQGEAVAHETILKKVWPDVVVAPNALQRCIAQLRKAFGDDAKAQQVIATHPKVGYSLLANVDWRDTMVEAKELEQTPAPDKTKAGYPQLGALILLIIIGVLLFTLITSKPQSETGQFSRLTPLTTTDNKGFYAAFSPDGRYVAFTRFTGACKRQLWAKDLIENREYQLTKEEAVYGPPAWSPDGKQLAFSYVTECHGQEVYEGCRDIRALSFTLAKNSTQLPRILLACKEQSYIAVNWINDDKIAFVADDGSVNKVQSLSLSDGKVTSLYLPDNKRIQALTYSARNGKLAVTQHDTMQNTSLAFVTVKSGEVEQLQLQIPERFSEFHWWDPSWHPSRDILLVSAMNTLFEINLNGEFTEHPIPTIQDIYHPVYHPDGKSVAATMGILDVDIGQYRWPTKNAKAQQTILHRSIVQDLNARYQPQGQQIAFVSNRSGSEEIWLGEGEQLRQLSNFGGNGEISSFVWSKDGKVLVAAVKKQLQLLGLDGQVQVIDTPFQVVNVYQWVNQREVLLGVIENVMEGESTIEGEKPKQQRKVVLFDIGSSKYKQLHEGYTQWAQLDGRGTLYFTDQKTQAMQLKDGKAEPVPGMEKVRAGRRFIYQSGQLVMLNRSKTLWLFDTSSQRLTTLLIPKPIESFLQIDDIDFERGQLLYTWLDSARKEIVLFHQ
jgi:DNA-binding winged helix-turn-helix (wHTH) protein/Tol biopolymer transport system component